jgi:DNA polymerase III alpha subunit (gram-positive type)
MRCPNCQGEECTQIEIHLEGKDVEFFSCRKCEHRWWEREGDSITLDDVLTLAARKDQKPSSGQTT